MGKIVHVEPTIFACAAMLLLTGAAAMHWTHVTATNPRMAYGLAHLSWALAVTSLFFAAIAIGYLWLEDRAAWEKRSTVFFLVAVGVTFCAFWLPVAIGGGFVQDDWLLLAAASVRQVIPAHPAASWVALDSVDGNFRPLGTVLYFGYLYKLFGLAPHIYLAGNFLLNFGTVVTGFLIVLELGYSNATAAMGAMLYLSRGLLYMQAGWVSALGDCIVTLLTASVILLLLKALRRQGAPMAVLHVAAWCLFALSTLGKQSSFTTPIVVVGLLLLRPGLGASLPWKRRAMQAGIAACVYGGTVAAVYLHARSLLENVTPYTLGLSLFATLRTFAYVFWYFETLYIPSGELISRSHPAGLFDLGGMLLAVSIGVLLYRNRRLLGERPRDLLFLLVAGLSSVSLFVLLHDRNAAYYGAMLAFWFSLGFAILLTRVQSFGPRRLALFGFSALVAIGFLDVRLKQIGMVWTGGYFWGEADVRYEGALFAELQRIVMTHPAEQAAVLIDPPIQPRFYAAMLYLLDPRLEHVLVYDSTTSTYFGNNRTGRRPEDGVPALRDVEAYSARTPLASATATTLISEKPTMWIRFREGGFSVDPAQARR